MGYDFGSTGLGNMYMGSSNSPMMMSVSSEAPMMWTTEAWPTANVEVRDPTPLERVCKWCGAMFESSEFYPGSCIYCGGPRGC